MAIARRPLGATGLFASAVSLGTVELGMAYGIGDARSIARPSRADAVALLHEAVDLGVTFFDTAPAYGTSESIVGEALGKRDVVIATKVSLPAPGADVRTSLLASIENSRRMLQRDRLDLVQVHNATQAVIGAGVVAGVLQEARQRGWITAIGASVYTEAEALAAIASGDFGMLQIPFSILDQRAHDKVFATARAAKVGLLTRSALLKGALTARSEQLPDGLRVLRDAAARARDVFGSWSTLASGAVRFCLSQPDISSVLVGVRDAEELRHAVKAAVAGPLSSKELEPLTALGLRDERLVNPALWPDT